MSRMLSPRRAAAFSFATAYVTLAVQFAVSIVIARLLSPNEIGIFSIAAAFIGLGHLIRDFGVSQYILQEAELTPERIRAAFSVTLVVGWSVAALVWLVAPVTGEFYEEPGVTAIVNLLAFNFLLIPFGSVTSAYLNRQMRLDALMVIKVSSTMAQAATSVACAFQGLSYMSLAWGAIAGSLVTILAASVLRPKDLPLLPTTRGLGHIFRFGTKIGATRILGHIADVIPELVMGKSLGMYSVGIWSRAQGTVNLFRSLIMQGASGVISPVFAKAKRHDEDLKPIYLYAVSIITGVGWPFYGALAVLAPELILVLFGSQWAEAAPIVQLWCISAAVMQLTSILGSVLVSAGYVNRMTKTESSIFVLRIIISGMAALISLQAVVITFMIFSALRLVLHRENMHEVLDVRIRELVLISAPSAVVGVSTAATALLVKHLISNWNSELPAATLGAGIVCSGLAMLIAIFLTRHPLMVEIRNSIEFIKGRCSEKST